MYAIIGLLLVSLIFVESSSKGCTRINVKTKVMGASMEISLPPGKKLVNVGWNNNSLWLLTRPFQKGEEVEIWEYEEISRWGKWADDKILIHETKRAKGEWHE